MKLRTRSPERETEACRAQRIALAENPGEAWANGWLWYKLDGNQLRAYRKIRAAISKPFGRYVLNWARRTGKTFLLLLICVEDAIRQSKRRFNVAAVTQKNLAQFIWPMFKEMLSDCPKHLRPWMDEAGGRIEFRGHHGREDASVIQMAGCDDRAAVERLRGLFSHGNVVEEMGTIPDNPGLRYLLVSVLNPQVKSTGGWNLGAMTPPSSSGHASAAIALTAEGEGEGSYDYCTTFDCPRYDEDDHLRYMESDAKLLGISVDEYMATVDFRREWLAIIETDPTRAVLPRFTAERKARIVFERDDEPIHIDRYVSMDIGFSPDWTAILYAYWSFERQKLRIVGERLMQRMGTPELAAAVAEDEERVFGYVKGGKDRPSQGTAPFLRVSDNNNPILLKDLATQFDLIFSETAKDELRAAVADVNRWIGDGTIEVDPSCKRLIAQMSAAIWNAKGTDYERTTEMGHFDLVAALVYLVRNVIPNINRVPRNWGVPKGDAYINNEDEPEQDTMLEAFFGQGR